MKYTFFCLVLLAFSSGALAQKTLTIWPGIAPGSENWKWREQTDSMNLPGDPLVYNIVEPVLVFYPAAAATANGTSVIICPGGSFSYLHIKTEGTDVAHWLNNKGVSAFVLKYRVVHSETSDPMKEKNQRMKDTSAARRLLTPVVPLALQDGKQAIAYVRAHAAELGIAANRIGILGFSAGGALASASAYDQSVASRPDFVAPIYPYVPPFLPVAVPADAPHSLSRPLRMMNYILSR